MGRKSNYDKFPVIPVADAAEGCLEGWTAILERLRAATAGPRRVFCVECYPGVLDDAVKRPLEEGLRPDLVIDTSELLKSPRQIDDMLADILGDDPVFGRMNSLQIADFLDESKVAAARERVRDWRGGLLLIVGTGASLVAPQPDLLMYADLARWEIQQRQRRNLIANLGGDNFEDSAAQKYKRAFFVDWRAADRLKVSVFSRIDFWLDTNSDTPKLVTGEDIRKGLHSVTQRPFRVVPYFDPGPWGGHWMEEVCGLPRDVPNHAWCFDCVPEENSLLLGFGSSCVEVPAMNVTLLHPRELLGEAVYERFGAEFPIRFDFLDTMGGGNLSLQVHPKPQYIREHFGMAYTQDESYYMLDAGPDASVYLGLKENIHPAAMKAELRLAQNGGPSFPAEKYINKFPARQHDHFLIPAGTVHCSGKDSMVLEISATPYIFTFKLWDWNRLGLNGLPRPIHLDHGFANIDWTRTTEWVRENLINRVEPLCAAAEWTEERTGLHELEFIETRRHWFTGRTPHHTRGAVNVLNLVAGEEAVVESPDGAFEPFVVHYAETFIVPAAVGAYTISPCGAAIGQRCATMKACVRHGAERDIDTPAERGPQQA